MSNAVEKHASMFAEAMIKAIRNGTAPWQKPWKGGGDWRPKNFATRRPYSGGNLLFLLAIAAERGYARPLWGGFHQIRAAGGHVRKGETGTPILIVKAGRKKTVETVDERGRTIEEQAPGRMFFTSQHVWNVAQADGLDLAADAPAPPAWDPIEATEKVAADAHVEIVEGHGPRAYYNTAADHIHLPARSAFESREAFYHTMLHELGHATAHPSRLDQPERHAIGPTDTAAYALEELRAEMAAMMTGARLEIGHSPRHGQSYVASWLKAAGDDPCCIRTAAKDAQAISGWLLRNHAESLETAPAASLAAAA